MGMKFAISDTGGGSSHFSAAPADIGAAATALAEHVGAVADGRRYGAVAGVGDYTDVAHAVSTMTQAWDPALDAWQRSLDSFAGAVDGAAVSIATTDDALSRAWAASSSTMGGLR